MSSAIDQVRAINLFVVNVTVSAILSAIALRSVLGRGDLSYVFVRNERWDNAALGRYLSRSDRNSAWIDVRPIPALVRALQSGNHKILAVCDASSRNRWQAALDSRFYSLLVAPQNESELYRGPGQVLLTRFAEEFEREKKFMEFTNLAVQVEAGAAPDRSGKVELTQKAVACSIDDTHADGRLTQFINQFAIHGVADDSIHRWLGGK
ncbi:MAG: hypothetical protein ABIP54_00965 [Candidatus Andersenbacteria bacterium]